MRILIPILLLQMLFACEKKEEGLPPKVEITSAIEGKTYRPGDTVFFEAAIEADQPIKAVKLSFIEIESKRNAGNIKYFEPNTKKYTFSHRYVLKDRGLKSGGYYFELLADDGEKQNADFASINIRQEAKKRMGFIFITSSSQVTSLYKQGDSTNFEKITSLNTSYAAAKINPIDQQLWLMPQGHADLLVYDLQKANLMKQFNPPSTQSSNAFSLLHYDDRQFFVGMNNGVLQAYDYQFVDHFTYASSGQYKPRYIALNESHILLVEQAQQYNKSRIRLLYRISGGIINSNILSKNIVGLHLRSEDRAYLVAKTAQGLEILDYDINRGVSNTLLQMQNTTEALLAFDQFEKGYFFMVTTMGLYKFIPPNRLLSLSRRPIAYANYDPLRHELLLLHEDSLHVYDLPAFAKKQSITFPKKLKAVLPWYNR